MRLLIAGQSFKALDLSIEVERFAARPSAVTVSFIVKPQRFRWRLLRKQWRKAMAQNETRRRMEARS